MILVLFTDLSIADEEMLMNFIPELADKICQPEELVYVHCWGGHGRTGIIIALLLSVLYNVDGNEALRLTELYHSKREECHSHSPQITIQCDQVKKIGNLLLSKNISKGKGEIQSLPLPELAPETASMKGPTPTSNWVIPGRLIAGAYPGNPSLPKHTETIKAIVESGQSIAICRSCSVMIAGVTCFVCLMTETEKGRFQPYETIAQEMAGNRTIDFQFFHMPGKINATIITIC